MQTRVKVDIGSLLDGFDPTTGMRSCGMGITLDLSQLDVLRKKPTVESTGQ
jgi:hypothetical protein